MMEAARADGASRPVATVVSVIPTSALFAAVRRFTVEGLSDRSSYETDHSPQRFSS